MTIEKTSKAFIIPIFFGSSYWTIRLLLGWRKRGIGPIIPLIGLHPQAGTFHTTTPGSQDKVIFDNNSFNNENQTITLDADNESVGDISWSGVSNNPKFNMGSRALIIYGSVKFDPLMTIQSPEH